MSAHCCAHKGPKLPPDTIRKSKKAPRLLANGFTGKTDNKLTIPLFLIHIANKWQKKGSKWEGLTFRVMLAH